MFVGFASIVRIGSMSVSPLSRLLPRSLRSEHSASGGAISAHATHQTVCHRVIGTSLQRLQRTRQSTHSKKKRGTEVAVRKCIVPSGKHGRSSHREGGSSGSQVALGEGPGHFRVHEVRLQLPLAFHVDDSSTRARVAQGLQDEAGLLRNLGAHGKRKAFRAGRNTARGL